MDTHRTVTLESVKYGGERHRTWEQLYAVTPVWADPQVLWGPMPTEVTERDGRRWTGPFPVVMYLWASLPYNVVTLLLDDTQHRHYCNACLPVEALSPHTYRYVDLDLDVLVDPEGGVEIVDRDEFALNRRTYAYPSAVIEAAERGVRLLDEAARKHTGPFSPLAITRLREIISSRTVHEAEEGSTGS